MCNANVKEFRKKQRTQKDTTSNSKQEKRKKPII